MRISAARRLAIGVLTAWLVPLCLASPALAQGYDPAYPPPGYSPGYPAPGYPAGAYPAPGQPEPGYGGAEPADPAPGSPPGGPDHLLRDRIGRLGAFLAATGSQPPDAVRQFIDREIAPYIDFDTMTRWVAGPLFRSLTPMQQGRMADHLAELFLGALARNLGSYARPLPRILVYPTRVAPWENEATVRAAVNPHSGLPIHLEFRCYRSGESWQVYDVSANGASAVAFYRRYFNEMFRRYGVPAVLQ